MYLAWKSKHSILSKGKLGYSARSVRRFWEGKSWLVNNSYWFWFFSRNANNVRLPWQMLIEVHLKILFLSHIQYYCCQFEQTDRVFASFGLVLKAQTLIFLKLIGSLLSRHHCVDFSISEFKISESKLKSLWEKFVCVISKKNKVHDLWHVAQIIYIEQKEQGTKYRALKHPTFYLARFWTVTIKFYILLSISNHVSAAPRTP